METTRLEIEQQVDLGPYNSFGIAATAAHFARITDAADLRAALDYSKQHHLPVLVLGGGTNLLFSKGFSGLILLMDWPGIDWLNDTGLVKVACGENWHEFVIQCLKKGFHGLENLALIPGTVGAAPIQNIGAYGVELEQFLVQLNALDTRTGQWHCFENSACEFGYRDSMFKQPRGRHFIITDITLQLSTEWRPNVGYRALRDALDTDNPTPQQVFDMICLIRRSKLPDPTIEGNAGSFFKNPLVSLQKFQALQAEHPDVPSFDTDDNELVKIPAAWLLEQAGWKGRQRGSAAVSEAHALVLVNPGQASGEDILLLAQEMSSSILQRFGIALELEVQVI